MLLLSPGTTTRPGGFDMSVGSATGSSGSGIAIGGRDSQNNFTLDGASNNARQFGNIAMRPSIDAIQEFKVQTNSYTADLGQAAFGQVSLITKSGTNNLHGSLFEFWRNNVFDARNTFLPKASRLNRNQFGGAVGRPDLAGTRVSSSSITSNTRNGAAWNRCGRCPFRRGAMAIFPEWPGLTLKDPSTGQPFPGNRIPKNLYSKTAKAAIALWPQQNFGGPNTTANNLLVTAPDRFSDGMLTVKIDHELTGKDRLSGRYSRAPHDETTTPGLPTFEQIIPPHNQIILMNWTRIFTPSLLGEFRGSFTRSEFVQRSPNTGKVGYYDQFGINNPLAGPQFEGAPSLTFTNVALTALRRRRLQHAAGYLERVQLCRKHHVDPWQPRDEGRIHADAVPAEYAGAGFRAEARQLQFPRRFHRAAVRRLHSGRSRLPRRAWWGRAWKPGARGGTAIIFRTIGKSVASSP